MMNYETGKMEGEQLLIDAGRGEGASSAASYHPRRRGRADRGGDRMGRVRPRQEGRRAGEGRSGAERLGRRARQPRRRSPRDRHRHAGRASRDAGRCRGRGRRSRARAGRAGQSVGAGQVLATIDRSVQVETAASLSSQISVARADLTLAQAELDRAQQLVDRGFISKADVQRRIATRDAAQARLRVAQATAGEQRARNARLDIRAPAAGLVLTRQVEPGQIVSSASGVLFRMAKGGEMEMPRYSSETDLQTIRVGARAEVTPISGARGSRGRCGRYRR
ncbi:efflux RND transporter periplasmic adaptor subunit [Sphingomonas sp. MMS24-JH45]